MRRRPRGEVVTSHRPVRRARSPALAAAVAALLPQVTDSLSPRDVGATSPDLLVNGVCMSVGQIIARLDHAKTDLQGIPQAATAAVTALNEASALINSVLRSEEHTSELQSR